MTDPNENEEQVKPALEQTEDQQSDNKENSNWDEHQQVDEEGNEVSAEDV